MLAELSELHEGRDSALELFQYMIDNDSHESQIWIVRQIEGVSFIVLFGVSSRSWLC